MLINEEGVNRCGACEEYRQTLNRMLYRHLNSQGKDDKTDSHSHTNYRHLSKPEMKERMKSLHSETRVCKQQISRLYARIDDLIAQRSIAVDDDLGAHLKDNRSVFLKGCGMPPRRIICQIILGCSMQSIVFKEHEIYEMGSSGYKVVPVSAPFVWK